MAIDTSAYKKRLEEMQGDLTAELKTIGIHNPDNPSDWKAVPENITTEPDPNSAADRVEEWDERRAIVATLETRYNNIARALKRIEDGTYGTCEICNGSIEEDRLNANPAARTDKAHLEEEADLPQ